MDEGIPTGQLRWRYRTGYDVKPVLEQEIDIVTQDTNGYALHNLSWRPVPGIVSNN